MDTEAIRQATGSDYCYEYRELPHQATLNQLTDYCCTTRGLFAPIAKAFTASDNSRWVLRHYLAIKFVTAASLLAGSASYASDRNLLLGVPYFNYYAVLSACRAYLLTSPLVKWDGAKTIEMTHQNILNRTADYMRALDSERREIWRDQLKALHATRDLYSYRFPLSGPNLVGMEAFDPNAPAALTRLIAELASLNTECFQAALKKYSTDNLSVLPLSEHAWATGYALSSVDAVDPADHYRFEKLRRGWRTVAPLQVMTSDGLLDDLYGSWVDRRNPGAMDGFNPDDYRGFILAL